MNARLSIWVQPRAGRSEVVGRHGEAIKIKLAAPPVEGAANDELVRFVAEKLGLPRSAVRLVGGQTSRSKTLEITGLSEAGVAARLMGSGGRSSR